MQAAQDAIHTPRITSTVESDTDTALHSTACTAAMATAVMATAVADKGERERQTEREKAERVTLVDQSDAPGFSSYMTCRWNAWKGTSSSFVPMKYANMHLSTARWQTTSTLYARTV